MSASAVSNPIFEIKATEDKTNMYIPMFSVSGKIVLSFGYLASVERALNICMDQKGCKFTIIVHYYVIKD